MASSLDNDLIRSMLSLLEKKAATTICIFDRTEFYMCFGDDAKFISSKVFQSNAFLKQLIHERKPIPYLTVNKNQFQRIIKDLLLVHQYQVELYQAKNKRSIWDLLSKASPGNLQDFEEIIADTNDTENATVVALKYITSDTGTKHVAIACCDKTNQQFIVSEFPDNIHFSSLQALLVQFTPKELLLPSNDRDADYKAIEPILRRFGVVSRGKSSDFTTVNVIQDLNRLLKFPKDVQPNAMALQETKLTGAMGCVASLVRYLQLLSESAAFGQFTLRKATFGQYLRLDANVVRSLELFELCGDSYTKTVSGAKSTLYGLLNHCRTAPGKRLLDEWIKMPLLDVNQINERLDIVEAFVSEGELCQTLSNMLSRFPDIQRVSRSFLKKRAILLDLYKFYQAAVLIPTVMAALEKLVGAQRRSVLHCLVEPLQELNIELRKLTELVTTTLDLENMKNYEIFIKPSYKPELADLKSQMVEIEENLQDEAAKAARILDVELGKSLKLETNSQFGYYLRVTNKDENVLRHRRGITILDSNKSGIKFHTTQFGEHNDSYSRLKTSYEKIQESIVTEVLEIAMSYLEPLQRLCSVMASLDVLLSFAVASRGYVRPQLLKTEENCPGIHKAEGILPTEDDGILELRGARHPCLETHDNLSFIPNDVYFERDKVEFILITGPNMGGKSTYLRQTGLIVLMAQIGCFVPCSSARLSVVDAIFTRVGASDAQLEGASTFRMEMIEMASILQAATSNSLILIDELGRGTATYDGCALAWSIAEHIVRNIRGWCMFATHFHELTALDIDLHTVRNLHVSADISDGLFTLLYQVKPGPCGSSFGVHIAQMLDLPNCIIEDATKILHEFAWSKDDGGKDGDAEAMQCEDSSGAPLPNKASRELSAATFVTEIQRIMKTDRDYSTVEEKARALRNLLTTI